MSRWPASNMFKATCLPQLCSCTVSRDLPGPPSDADLARLHTVLSNGGRKFNLSNTYTIKEHMEHVMVFASLLGPLLAPGTRIVDLGSGSGILGYMCAIMYPDAHITLLDMRHKCCDFLQGAIGELTDLGISDLRHRVTVLHVVRKGSGCLPNTAIRTMP